jgi:ketosteroid isomerase-like protein
MPATATDVVRANNAAFCARDIDRMLALHAPDAVVEDRRATGFGTFHGHGEVRAHYLGIFDNADALDEELQVLAEQGDTVVADCTLWAHLAADESSDGVTMSYGLLYTVRDGYIVRLEIHGDGHEALAASGLSV